MTIRKIARIDEEKCNGCGLCIPSCAEGAFQIIEGKAKLISDKLCDGLGACLGHCPQDAIIIIEREAEDFDEKTVEAHLHKKHETQSPSAFTGCPSSKAMHFKIPDPRIKTDSPSPQISMLSHWPIQLRLVPINAAYFQNADLLIVADCVPFAYPNFHQDLLKGKIVTVGCPKLDDIQYYTEKLSEIFKTNSIKSITVPYMEVPCCFGLVKATEDAIAASGQKIPFKKVKIGIRGEIKNEESERTPPNF